MQGLKSWGLRCDVDKWVLKGALIDADSNTPFMKLTSTTSWNQKGFDEAQPQAFVLSLAS